MVFTFHLFSQDNVFSRKKQKFRMKKGSYKATKSISVRALMSLEKEHDIF